MNTENVVIEFKGIAITETMMNDLKEWVMDCSWGEGCDFDVEDYTALQICRGVDRNYDGGIAAFDFYGNSINA